MQYQPPKGTRDFYPREMALRRYLERHWRAASIRSGFEEVEGPIFESLDLYKAKSGEGIVSELFHFKDRGDRELAIRPEFTPTLARMVAAKANSLTKPIKWFCTPNLCRAERPQRGRLREFLQWNVDLLGVEGPSADAEVIFTAVDAMRGLGLKPQQVRVKISHRQVVRRTLAGIGIPDEKIDTACALLDKRDRMETHEFTAAAATLGLDPNALGSFDQAARSSHEAEEFSALRAELEAFGIGDWCEIDMGIVRGLAYYTGTVFEVHEASGAERAIAGGGRYDQLIESLGGPPTPAIGFGMGDVVLSLVLADRGLIPDDVAPPVDAFVFAAKESARIHLTPTVATLRTAGLHTRFSYRATTNVGKLLKEAAAFRARFAVILDDASSPSGHAAVKDLQTGEQSEIQLSHLADHIRSARAAS